MRRGSRFPWLAAMALVLVQFIHPTTGRAATWIELPLQEGQPHVFVTVTKTAASARAPVAIILHGTSGLTRYNQVALEMWADWLAERGVISVIIDSYRGRGLRGDDDVQNAKWIPVAKGRVVDIQRTLSWLSTQDWADPSRVFLFGLSNGATVGIYAATEGNVTVPQVQLYPFCNNWVQDSVHAKAGFPPSLWVSGEKDAIARLADTRKCQEKIAAAGNRGVIKLVVLPGAQHAFDRSPRESTYSAGAIAASKVEIESFLKARGLTR
jgi:dienelactone hydrolase